jgi:hypothetical protein
MRVKKRCKQADTNNIDRKTLNKREGGERETDGN